MQRSCEQLPSLLRSTLTVERAQLLLFGESLGVLYDWRNVGCMNLVLSSAVLFSHQQHCSRLLCITMCENNEELSGSEDEQNRNMWNGVLSLVTDCFTGPWIQLCLGDEVLARTVLTCRYAVDCLYAELYAL